MALHLFEVDIYEWATSYKGTNALLMKGARYVASSITSAEELALGDAEKQLGKDKMYFVGRCEIINTNILVEGR